MSSCSICAFLYLYLYFLFSLFFFTDQTDKQHYQINKIPTSVNIDLIQTMNKTEVTLQRMENEVKKLNFYHHAPSYI